MFKPFHRNPCYAVLFWWDHTLFILADHGAKIAHLLFTFHGNVKCIFICYYLCAPSTFKLAIFNFTFNFLGVFWYAFFLLFTVVYCFTNASCMVISHMLHKFYNCIKVYIRANILWLTDTYAYLFRFPGEYYKITIIIYWVEVLPFVGLKEFIIGNLQTR